MTVFFSIQRNESCYYELTAASVYLRTRGTHAYRVISPYMCYGWVEKRFVSKIYDSSRGGPTTFLHGSTSWARRLSAKNPYEATGGVLQTGRQVNWRGARLDKPFARPDSSRYTQHFPAATLRREYKKKQNT